MKIDDFKKITEARVESAVFLGKSQDWYHASFTMAMALECALKALVCKTLNLKKYPQVKENRKIVDIFWTHEFEQLKVLAGLSDVFEATAIPAEPFRNWSEFTKVFSGNWSSMKYDFERQQQFDEQRAKRLHKYLTDVDHGIITIIKQRW